MKMQQLSNRAQEFWATVINSEALKNGIDLLSTLLGGLNDFIDAVGVLPTLFGTVGAALSFKNAGIFKVDLDNKKVLNDSFKGLFNGDFFEGGMGMGLSDGTLLSESDVSAIKAYNAEIDACVTSQTAFNRTMLNASETAQNAVAAANGNTVALGEMTTASKAAEVGMKALSVAENMIATALISWAISEAITYLNDLAHAAENARQKSEELTSSYKDEKESINDSITQYKELAEQLNNTSLSTSEVKSIKEQLLSVQDQLNEKYGLEATQIDLVNGKYDEQIEKLDTLAKKKTAEYLAENGTNIKEDRKYASEKFNVDKSLGFKGSVANPDDYSNVGFDLKSYLNKYDKLDAKVVETDGQFGLTGDVTLITDGTREEVYDQLVALYNELTNDFGESNPAVTAFQETLNSIIISSFDADALATAKENIKEYARAQILENDSASESYNNLVDAMDAYNKALSSGNGVDKAKANLLEAKDAAEEATGGITNAGDVLQDVYNSLNDEAPIEFQLEVGKDVDEELQKSYNDTINRFKTTITKEQAQQLEDAKQNLEDEYLKISDWGLDDYIDQIKNGTIQTKFGNVDMDKRTIIHWSNELKQTYADALASWDYDPEVGSIDTVFGGSERFGEDLDGNGWEIAFTPILPDGTFLSKDTVEEYINSILTEAYVDDEKVTEDELIAIDAQGRQIGSTFVQGIFAGIDDSQNYDNNGNWAETVGRLMHFTGKFGAVQIAEDEISDLEKRFGVDGAKTIEDFFETEGINDQDEIDYFNDVTEGAKTAEDAIKAYNKAKRSVDETPISFEDYLNKEDNSDIKESLLELAKSGQVTDETFNTTKEYRQLLIDLGLSASEAAEKIKEMATADSDMGDWQDQLQNARTSIEELTTLKSDISSSGLTDDSLDTIISKYPELLAYSDDAKGMISAIDVLLAKQKNAAQEAGNSLLDYSTVVYDEVVNTLYADCAEANSNLIDELAEGYGIDLENYSSLAEAKADIDAQLLDTLADAWGEYYGIVVDSATGLASITKNQNDFYRDEDAQNQLATYNETITKLNAAKDKFNSLDFGSYTPDSPSGEDKEGASSSDSKEEIDWIERKLSVLQTAIDLTKSKLENLFNVKAKSNNIQKQISQTKDLLDATRKAATRYKQEANKVKLSDELKKKVRNGDYDITEYSSEIADAINEYQEKYDNYKSMQQQVQELKQSIRELKQDKNQLYIDRADARQEMSEANQANKRVNNAKALNKSVEYQKKQVRQSYNYQIKNAKLEKDSVKVATLKAEKQQALRELTLQEAENIQAAYDNRLKSNEATQDAIADALTLAETQGNVIGKAYYTGQIATTKKDLKERQKELTDLQNKQKSIKKYTQEWYDAQEMIDDVKAAIRQDEISIAEFQNSINELKWDRFDELINKLEDVSTEIDFLKNTLSDTLFDDQGNITDDGLTAMGLTLMNGNVAMSKRDYYKQQLAQLEKDYANGPIGYTTYIEKQREYNQGLQDSISSIVEAKKATVDYVEQGLDAQNEALSEAIEKQKTLLEEEQTLKEWNDKLAESNKNIARMQRRLAIISQDTSEENQKAIRELKSELEDAQKEQDDDFYEKSIEDQEDALDQMLENAEQQAEDYLKNTEQVFSDATAYINANSQVVASNITQISKTLGYDISTYITDAWTSGGNAIVNYSSTLTENVGGICTQISAIKTAWDDVCTAADKAAKAMVAALKAENSTTSSSNSNNNNNNNKNTVYATGVKAYGKGVIYTYADGSKTYSSVPKSASTNKGSKLVGVNVSGWKVIYTYADGSTKIQSAAKTKENSKKSSYATGGIVDGIIKSTGEDGIAFLRRGEAVLSQEQTKALLNFKTVLPQVDSLMSVLKDIPKDTNATLGQSVNIINNTTVEGVATDKIVKDFENVAAKQAENVVKRINNATYTKGVRR
jgi:hypothetical protein